MNAETPKKPMTLDDLAEMVAKGFENTPTKQDLENSITAAKTELKADIAKLDDGLKIIETKLNKALYTDMVKLEARVKKIE